jgi:hypothetical protein
MRLGLILTEDVFLATRRASSISATLRHMTIELQVMDTVGPALGAAIFVLAMSRVPRDARLTLNAVLVTGAAGAYLSGGGLGVWELAYPALATPMLMRATTSFRWIGIAWLAHAAWDLVHHFVANPIWPFMPTSSWGCAIFDSAIALWFLVGAPTPARTRPDQAA